jgi:prepilin-type N-terminal cleavage/methylation domain-containing protein
MTRRDERGFSLIETVFALSLLLIVALGLLPLGIIATTTTENMGHLSARTTEYAQDKLEQLLALSYGDTTSDTRVFPATDVDGSGLSIGGSADPESPVELYVDYLDINGTLIPSEGTDEPDGWFYKRVWEVTSPQANLKQVTVTAIVKTAVGGVGVVPQSTVTALKTFPF